MNTNRNLTTRLIDQTDSNGAPSQHQTATATATATAAPTGTVASPHPLAMSTILSELNKNMGEFEKQVRSQLSDRLGRQAANEGKDAARAGARHGGRAESDDGAGGFTPYAVSAGEEMPNLLGELAEPGSVFRMNTLLSTAFPFGPVGPYTNERGQVCQRREGRVSIALLGSGDQTLVLPTPTEPAEIARQASPRVCWIRAAKTRVPGVPGDALLVTGMDQPRSGRGSGPWLLDHLGLSGAITAHLNHAILSLTPAHQAVFMSAIAQTDIEQALVALLPEVRAGSVTHPLAVGAVAAKQVNTPALSRDETSLVRLACLIADLGSLRAGPDLASSEVGSSHEDLALQRMAERAAHPLTQHTLRGLLARFINLEPTSPADGLAVTNEAVNEAVNQGDWLQLLLTDAVHQQYRIGSKYGPLGKHPINPRFALMAQVFGDAMRLARQEARARLRDAKHDAQQPLPLEPMPTLVTAALARVPGEQRAQEPLLESDDVIGASADEGIEDLLALEPQEGPLTEEPEFDGSDVDDSGSLSLSILGASTRVRVPDHERRAYESRSIPWPRPSLSWAAGMLDGDGCVAIVRQTYPNRASTYRLVVQVTQNCLQTLKHFRVSVGVPAPIHEVKRRIGHNRQVYVLNYTGPKAVLVLQRLSAHLVRKRPEAEVALSFIDKGQAGRRFGPRGVPAGIEQIRISHYNKLRALK